MSSNPELKSPLALWGAGGHASVVLELARLAGSWRIECCLDDVSPDRIGTPFHGIPVRGGDALVQLRAEGCGHLVVAIGDNRVRMEKVDLARRAGFVFPSLIHPAATVSRESTMGAGTVVMARVVLNPGSAVGDHVIVNTGTIVEHDGRIASGVHLSPGAILGGGVVVDEGAWIGMGAVVKNGLRIGKNAVVGAGAVVLQDVPDGATVVGNPARPLDRK